MGTLISKKVRSIIKVFVVTTRIKTIIMRIANKNGNNNNDDDNNNNNNNSGNNNKDNNNDSNKK